MEEQFLTPFASNAIRKVWHNKEWYFSIIDIIQVLIESPIPRTYWSKQKAKMKKEGQLNPIWVQLKMPSSDGKNYEKTIGKTIVSDTNFLKQIDAENKE